MIKTLALMLILAAPLAAQTVELVIDLSGLGWGNLAQPIAVETDANVDTREWLIQSLDTGAYRVVAVRPSGLCVGTWFDPGAQAGGLYGPVTVALVGRVSKLIVTPMAGVAEIIGLQTPPCS